MELDKCITRAESASTQLKSSVIKDIGKIADAITTTYKITKSDGQPVGPQEIASFVSRLFSTCNTPLSCVAITKNGTQCTGAPSQNSKYCRRHQRQGMIAKIMSQQSKSSEEPDIGLVTLSVPNKGVMSGPLKKVFIDDTFYLVDDTYIYHQDTTEKVGYINPDTRDFILTDDPFELGVFGAN
jgi:hypothetical protein